MMCFSNDKFENRNLKFLGRKQINVEDSNIVMNKQSIKKLYREP